MHSSVTSLEIWVKIYLYIVYERYRLEKKIIMTLPYLLYMPRGHKTLQAFNYTELFFQSWPPSNAHCYLQSVRDSITAKWAWLKINQGLPGRCLLCIWVQPHAPVLWVWLPTTNTNDASTLSETRSRHNAQWQLYGLLRIDNLSESTQSSYFCFYCFFKKLPAGVVIEPELGEAGGTHRPSGSLSHGGPLGHSTPSPVGTHLALALSVQSRDTGRLQAGRGGQDEQGQLLASGAPFSQAITACPC